MLHQLDKKVYRKNCAVVLIEIAEILIANGADLNAVDKGGRTPLTRAEDGNHKDMVKLLISHGAHK
jgi:ankyrin repeat protein